jgi:hypothetical protein
MAARRSRELEGCADGVSNRLEDEAGVLFDGRTYQRIVTGERPTHLAGKFFP